MLRVYVPNEPFDTEHLNLVKKTAKRYGSVCVAGYKEGRNYYCLDGSHRVRVANELGLPLSIVIVNNACNVYLDCISNFLCLEEEATTMIKMTFELRSVDEILKSYYDIIDNPLAGTTSYLFDTVREV